MKNKVEVLRHTARKLIRELGILELDSENGTPCHCHALVEISKDPGITISQLGRLLIMSVSSVSRLVKTLEENEYLVLKGGHDKREKALFLTDKGDVEIQKINAFSNSKIIGALEILTPDEIDQIIHSINKYGGALEKSRIIREEVKIFTLSTSRTIRKQIINMISHIQKHEYSLPITHETNVCVLQAEKEFYYNNSYNFWYAADSEGKILGSIGLKKINGQYGQIKKFFVAKEYRGKGIAQKLMNTLVKAATKHNHEFLILGTVDKFNAAHRFYEKYGFNLMEHEGMPQGFERAQFDGLFYQRKIA